MAEVCAKRESGTFLSVSSAGKAEDLTDVIGGHGPWQFRSWVIFFLASVCCCLHLFATFPLSSRTPCSCRFQAEADHSKNISSNIPSSICSNSSNCFMAEKNYFYTGEESCEKLFGGRLEFFKGNFFCSHNMFVIYAKCVFICGCFISAISVNWLTNRFGRRVVSLVLGAVLVISAIATSWTQDQISFLVLRLLVSYGIVSIYLISSSTLAEFTSSDYTLVYQLFGHIGWCIAHAAIPLTVWISNDWKCFNVTLTIATFVLFVSLFFIPESLECCAGKGLWSKINKTIRTAAHFNGYSTEDIDSFAKHFYTPKDSNGSERKLSMNCSKENLRIFLETTAQFLIGFLSSFHYFVLVWLTDWYGDKRGGRFALLGTCEVAALLVLLFASYFASEKHLWSGSTVLLGLSLVGMYFKTRQEVAVFSTLLYLTTMFFSAVTWTMMLLRVSRRSFPQKENGSSQKIGSIFGIGICFGSFAATLTDLQKYQDWSSFFLLTSAVPTVIFGVITGLVPERICVFF